MTNEEFLNRLYASSSKVSPFQTFTAEEIEDNIREHYSGVIDTSKIVEFLLITGNVDFDRIEKGSNDELRFGIGWGSKFEYWQDINCVVNLIGSVDNCAGRIEWFYISEEGKFYNQDHKLLSEDIEGFAEYISTVEYDYHPKTTQRTYDMLHFFGWYEGRHIDTTAFEQELARRGIELSETQRKFFSEFSGLSFDFDGDFWCIYSLEQIMKEDKITDPVLEKRNPRKHPTILCGDTVGGPLAVDAEGIIRYFYEIPWGRTTMECINHLCMSVSEDWKWIPPKKD